MQHRCWGPGTLTATGNAVLGSSSTATLTVNAAASFASGLVNISGSSGTAATGPAFAFQRRGGSGATPTGFSLGTLAFQTWDGTAYLTSAQVTSRAGLLLLNSETSSGRNRKLSHASLGVEVGSHAKSRCSATSAIVSCVLLEHNTSYLPAS